METKDWIEMAGAAVALVGLAIGLYQYYVAQKWKKSEFAAGQLELLTTDSKLEMCCLFLDWAVRTFPVPERYKIGTEENSFKHNWGSLAVAMLPEEQQWFFKWPLALYIDVFEYFFAYFERISQFISTGLVGKRDVENLRYWLKCIESPRFKPRPVDLGSFSPETQDTVLSANHQVFRGFLERYDHQGVIDLMQRFGMAMDWGQPRKRSPDGVPAAYRTRRA